VQVVTAPPAEVAGSVQAVQPPVASVWPAKVAYSSAAHVKSAQDPSASEYWPIGHENVHAVAFPAAAVP